MPRSSNDWLPDGVPEIGSRFHSPAAGVLHWPAGQTPGCETLRVPVDAEDAEDAEDTELQLVRLRSVTPLMINWLDRRRSRVRHIYMTQSKRRSSAGALEIAMNFFKMQEIMFGNRHPFKVGYNNMSTVNVINNRPTEQQVRLMRGVNHDSLSSADIVGAQADTKPQFRWKSKRVTDPLCPIYPPIMSTKLLASQFDAAYNKPVNWTTKTDVGGFIRHAAKGIVHRSRGYDGDERDVIDFTKVDSSGWDDTYKFLSTGGREGRMTLKSGKTARSRSCEPSRNENYETPVVRSGNYQNINLPPLQPGRVGHNVIAEYTRKKVASRETARLERAIDQAEAELNHLADTKPDTYDKLLDEAAREVAEDLMGKERKPMFSLLSTDIEGAQPRKLTKSMDRAPGSKHSNSKSSRSLYTGDIDKAKPHTLKFTNSKGTTKRARKPVNPVDPQYGDIVRGGSHHLKLMTQSVDEVMMATSPGYRFKREQELARKA